MMDAARECSRRAKDIFAALDSLEEGYKEYLSKSESVEIADDLMKSDCFEERNPRKRTYEDSEGPDEPSENKVMKQSFVRDASKWTEYSLADVTEDQMSDTTNRQAAYDCLKSLGMVGDVQVQDEGEFDPKSVFGELVKNRSHKMLTGEVQKPLVGTGIACRMLTELEEIDEDKNE